MSKNIVDLEVKKEASVFSFQYFSDSVENLNKLIDAFRFANFKLYNLEEYGSGDISLSLDIENMAFDILIKSNVADKVYKKVFNIFRQATIILGGA